MQLRNCFVLISAIATSHGAFGETVTIGSSKDNTLYENAEGSLSNGSGNHFFAGTSAQEPGQNVRRGLITFGVGSAVPAGATITSVTLELNMSRTQAGPELVSLHRALSDWGEGASVAEGQEGAGAPAESGDATWVHTFYPDTLWSSPGGDFSSAASDSAMVDSEGGYAWSGAGLVADVQAWVDGSSNFGWLVIGDESEPGTSKRFDTHEINNANKRPMLTIEFDPPAGTGACCFGDGGCLVLTGDDCLTQGGVYEGDGNACDPNPCPQPTGACCLVDETCIIATMGDCLSRGGAYQGDDVVCGPDTCVPSEGACCLSGAVCALLLEADCTAQGGVFQGEGVGCGAVECPLNLAKFIEPLPIPPVLQPVSGQAGGEATYDIAVTQFAQQLHSDLPPTTVWGYAGSYPGPTIEATTDLPVTVNWINDLRDEQGNLLPEHYLPVDLCLHGPNMAGPSARIVTHLHGGHIPADVDGYPENTFLPGEQVQYVFPNKQPPLTAWYHDHALGITRLNVYMGLAGFYLIRDAFEAGLKLPDGAFEIPVVIQDRAFDTDGSLSYPADWQDHFFGDTIVVNGKVWPFLEVARGKYRLRLLNGSTSRSYRLSLSDGATFWQIGTDGGLLPAPVPLTELTITPGERADCVFDFESYEAGTELLLTNDAPAPFPNGPIESVLPEVMKFIVTETTGFTGAIPDELRPVEPIDEGEAVAFRELELRKGDDECTGTKWLINGLLWDDITEFPVLGTAEVWSFINRSGITHPMHMHLVQFQVLDRQAFEVIDGEVVPVGEPMPPADNEAGWKDTVRVDPFEIVRVIARFEDYTGKFPYHCHILEHEDHEMMRQFEVVPGCEGDLNGDLIIDSQDLNAVLGDFGCDAGMGLCPGDADGDGDTDSGDLNIVLGLFGEVCQ